MSSSKRARSSEENEEKFDEEINLNVGGTVFTTTLATLTRFPDTKLGAMFSGRHDLHKNAAGAYLIDRDGLHFREILNFLRAPAMYDQTAMTERAKIELAKELEYYGLTELVAKALAARDVKAPVEPSPPMKMRNNCNKEVTFSQGNDGVWAVSGNVIKMCRVCGCGLYGSNTYYIPNFTLACKLSESYPCATVGIYSYLNGQQVLSKGKCHHCDGK